MKLHTIQGYIQTIYLVEYPDKLMMLDGASRADVPLLHEFITQTLERPMTDLRAVIVTHMHPDHAGAAHKLRELSGCLIIAADKETDWYRGISGKLMYLADLALARWVATRVGSPRRHLWFPPSLKPDIKLKDGETIPAFPEWKVLETPGHTDRDLSVYYQPEGWVYVADLLVRVKKKLVAPFPVFYPNQYKKSVTRIYELNASRILLAHGGETKLDEPECQHVMETAPLSPATHWRVIKLKARSVLRSVWSFGFLERKNQT